MSVALCFGLASCVKEQIINDTDTPRHQIEGLNVVAGDEEVTLSWSVPEGWEPTDYKITFSDDASVQQTILTGGETTYTITGLVNEFSYTFNVQAIYGTAISNVVKVSGKPVTSRIPVAALNYKTADKDQVQQYIELTWEKPSDLVLNYTLTYYPEMDDSKLVTKTIDANATSYKIEGITNGDNYVITLVANYPKGVAPEAKTTVYFKMAYITSSTVGAIGQTIDFSFNKEAYPDATDITWKFPDGTVQTGESVTWTITTAGQKEVILSAKTSTKEITWPGIQLNLRNRIIETNDFIQNGTNYNGFKGSYPVFSPDGNTIYAITFNGITALYAYDLRTGAEKWRYQPAAKAGSYNPLTVNPVTGDIYFGTQTAGQFYCVAPDGTLKWHCTTMGNMKSTAPAVSADGTIVYAVDAAGKIAALKAADGSEIWSQSLGAAGHALLINNNDLVVAVKSTAKSVRFLNIADGTEIASADCSIAPSDVVGFAVSNDKKYAYIPLATTGGMASVNLETREKAGELIFGTNNMWAPVVASNGFVVVGSKDGSVYALSADLSKVEWTHMHQGKQTNNVYNYSHPCADTQGHVYITAGQPTVVTYVFDAATGNVVSSSAYDKDPAARQMGGNNYNGGFFYEGHLGAGSVNAYLVGHFVGGERKFWGGPGGDICGSSCIQSPLL